MEFSPQKFVDVEGLPRYQCNNDIIVSMPVGEFLANNRHLYCGAVYSPDTSPASAIRNEQGTIVGVKRLVLYKERDS